MEKLLFPYTNEIKQVGVALITFFYVDFLDTSGTLMALASSMGFVDENGDFPKSRLAFSADAIATIIGTFFGLSPVTSYIESGAGVAAGSRTGLTAVFCSFFFFISIFFAPIIASIPPWATGGALVVVGSIMSKSLKEVKWYVVYIACVSIPTYCALISVLCFCLGNRHNPTHAISAFLTVMIMPLTYSIAYGLVSGIMVFVIMEGTFYLLEKAFGIPRPNYDDEEEEEGEIAVTEDAEEGDLKKQPTAIVDDPSATTRVNEPEKTSDSNNEEASA